MGGKNPAIVSRPRPTSTAAADGRGPLGVRLLRAEVLGLLAGVRRARRWTRRFTGRAGRAGRALRVGDPTWRETRTSGPVIDDEAVERFEEAVEHAREQGRVVAGGEVPRTERPARGPLRRPDRGRPTCRPTTGCSRDELFVPFVAVAPVDSLDEAIDAGQRHRPRPDRRLLLRRRRRGRASSSTRSRPASSTSTGRPARRPAPGPGVQPFGGWKGSGTAGKAGGGLYYVQQFMREQSRTVVTHDLDLPGPRVA